MEENKKEDGRTVFIPEFLAIFSFSALHYQIE